MYHSTIASSSHHALHNPWGPPHSNLSFPTSDLRSSPPPSQPNLAGHSRIPPHSAPSSCHPISSKYSTSVPAWKEIQTGVWSDGTDRVLSAAYPPVQEFLATARRRMSLPVSPSELIFAIAALEVFYSRNDPVHWMFWSDDKKHDTAGVVNRIALRSPQLIRSKVAWNGISEYLFILSGLHGPSSLPIDKEWYHTLNPSKAPLPPMNLRKRKIQRLEQTESLETPEEEEGSEAEEPRPKRSKTRPTRAVKPKAPVIPDAKLDSNDLAPAFTAILLPEEKDTLSKSVAALQGNVPSMANPLQAKPSRQKPASRQSSSTPDPSALPRAASHSPASDLLTPAPTSLHAAISHTRNRSTSQASSQTLVSASERRSLSVLSNTTAVEPHTVEGATAKVIKADQPASDSEEADGKDDEEESTGMVTRGRANKARGAVARGKASRPTKPRAKRRVAK
ncbi:hypothetical protein D9615_004525 [Tricholomella constricta]|uniref:Uncharacterized protein n=1 Tax=Tricholomella constricta TaxID=117010 RepID=A0A8H5M4H3_9AGAR|nr:hypothetical protein D9615_004525 [Tricholomella constricta]